MTLQLPSHFFNIPLFISQITCSSPSHPANSFYYPKLKILPPIAQVTMVKIKKSQLGLSAPFINLPAKSNEVIDTVSGKWLVDVLNSVISIHSEVCGNLAGAVDETGDQAEYSPICIGRVPDSQTGNKTSQST